VNSIEASIGIEANPMAFFASKVKTDWSPNPDDLLEHAKKVAEIARAELESQGIDDDPPLPLFQAGMIKRCGNRKKAVASSRVTKPGRDHPGTTRRRHRHDGAEHRSWVIVKP
jgi:hypothetical protein